MRIKSIWVLVYLFALLAGCTSASPVPTPVPTAIPTPTAGLLLRFENDLVAFDYPAQATLFTPPQYTQLQPYGCYYKLGGDLVVGFTNPNWTDEYGTLYSLIAIYRHELPTGLNLQEAIQSAYKNISGPHPEEVTEQTGPFTVDGQIGVSRTYRSAVGPLWYTTQDIWLEVDGSILRISLTMEVYESDFEAVADQFLASMDINENPPPFTKQLTPTLTMTATPYPANQLLHFENDALAFDYPQFLNVLPANRSIEFFPDMDFGGELIVSLGDARFLTNGVYYRSIKISQKMLPSGSNLELEALGAYESPKNPLDPSSVFLKGGIPVAGMTGFQLPYRVTAGEPTYELRDIWLEVNDKLYIISIWTEYTNPDDFWLFQSGSQALLDSLIIK